jgi:hypothetical protein
VVVHDYEQGARLEEVDVLEPHRSAEQPLSRHGSIMDRVALARNRGVSDR